MFRKNQNLNLEKKFAQTWPMASNTQIAQITSERVQLMIDRANLKKRVFFNVCLKFKKCHFTLT
jgi:hypothetical protein